MYHHPEDQDLKVTAVVTALITCLSIIAMLLILFGCQYVPEMAKALDDIETDDAITIQIDRDAFKKDTDVFVEVKVINKDRPNALNQVQK